MLQAQAHKNPITGVIHFCHTSCVSNLLSRSHRRSLTHIREQFLYDGGSVVNYLNSVKAFLDANPNEAYALSLLHPYLLGINFVLVA